MSISKIGIIFKIVIFNNIFIYIYIYMIHYLSNVNEFTILVLIILLNLCITFKRDIYTYILKLTALLYNDP